MPHHITQRGNRRQNVFFEPDDRVYYLNLLGEYCDRHKVEIIAYCLMTNHVHHILIPNEEDGLQKVLKPLHMRYATRINKRFGWTGHLWQARFFSSPLYDEYFWKVLKYVERNPVEAGMVVHAADHPWSSAVSRCAGKDNPLLTNSKSWVNKLTVVDNWYSWLEEPNSVEVNELIRRHTARDLPLAPEEVLEGLAEAFGRCVRLRPIGRPRKK